MGLKTALVLITVVAVVCDTLLHPFYPQFFAQAFGVTDPRHVGWYIGASSLTVMLALPIWARIARGRELLRLLVYSQLAAGALGLLCYGAYSLAAFWVLSLAMLVFKASYLLVYPCILQLEDRSRHIGTIGLLAVIVHFGAIGGALSGGLVLEFLQPRQVFLLMAAGDFLQTGLCVWLLCRGWSADPPATDTVAPVRSGAFVYKLGVVMLLFYFSTFLIQPFFALYWETLSGIEHRVLSGAVYAIPGAAALVALWLLRRGYPDGPAGVWQGIAPAMLLATAGLALQAAAPPALVLIGRVLYGWALFQATVRLDLLLFQVSNPGAYAIDFSKIHFFQSAGILLASFAAGALIAAHGLRLPFYLAAAGCLAAVVLYRWLARSERCIASAETNLIPDVRRA